MKQRFSHIIICCLVATVTWLASCSVEPPLHLYRGVDIIFPEKPEVHMNVNVMWQYDFDIDWRIEWQYGWDALDSIIFDGPIGYKKPEKYELRRYYLNATPSVPHTQVERFQLDDSTFFANYEFGYYDMLLWNQIITPDGIQSIYINEQNMDNVTAETNRSLNRMYVRSTPNYSKAAERTYYEPEDLFSLYLTDIHISADPADYEYYDPERRVYYKKLNGTLQPIVYIYLPQLILYHNNGRINAVDGNAMLTGMARRTSVNTGVTEDEAINVFFHDRIKRGITLTSGARKGEKVDIIGGQLHTFGLCSTNPYTLTRARIDDKEKHEIFMNVQFYNGSDTTLVFDVTNTVRKRYRGGVITMELDVDSVKIPQQQGGSGFDAQVADYEEETHEIEM